MFFFRFADPQNPLVQVTNPLVNGAQYQDIVIPCKPTSKMWDIQLIKEGDEVKYSVLILISSANALSRNANVCAHSILHRMTKHCV